MNSIYTYDLALIWNSHRLIGIDEAGRGALAGPVVVAAVVLDYQFPIEGINDSKKLSPIRRERLFAEITASAQAYFIVEVNAAWIDAHNILQATLKGMREAAAAIAASRISASSTAIRCRQACPVRPAVLSAEIHSPPASRLLPSSPKFTGTG